MFPQIVNPVSTVASMGRLSDANPIEKGKSDVIVDVAVGHPPDGPTGVFLMYHWPSLSDQGWPDFIS